MRKECERAQFRVSCFGTQISGFGFRDALGRNPTSRCGRMLEFRVHCSGFRAYESGLRVTGVDRCRANSAHITQSRPDSGLGLRYC